MTRTRGHWVLPALALVLLAAFGAFVWWFGPWDSQLGFGLWAIASAPLLVRAYGMTRVRWLLYLGTGLVPGGLVVALTSDSVWYWGSWPGTLAVSVCAGLPVALTVAWLHRFLGRSTLETQTPWTIMTWVPSSRRSSRWSRHSPGPALRRSNRPRTRSTHRSSPGAISSRLAAGSRPRCSATACTGSCPRAFNSIRRAETRRATMPFLSGRSF